jgi:hypothetical protein
MGDFVNSKQARFDVSKVSCGVVELHHLPDESPSATVFALANNLYHKANGRPAAFVLFSDVVDRHDSRGVALAEEIKHMQVGPLFESRKDANPKTGHVIRVWLLSVDHDKFKKWYTEEYVNRITETS